MASWTSRLVASAGAAALFVASAPRAAAQPVPPTVVALTLDTSGSVGPEQLARGRVLAERLLKSLPAGSEVAVFTFDDASRLVVPRTSRSEDVRRRLATLKISGRHSALFDALYDASRYLRDAPGTRKAIVLITDGRDEESALNLDDGLRVAQEAGIPVHAVAVGQPDARVLRRIAKLTGGSYARLGEVKIAVLAAQLRNVPAAGAAPPRIASGSPQLGDTAARPPPETANSATPEASAARPAGHTTGATSRSRLPWILGPALLAAAAAAAVVLMARRRRAGSTCPICSREIAGPGARCPVCSAVSTGGLRDVSPRPIEDDLSPTVLARMNVTEEYLEKTVTLRPRPILSITRGADTGQVVELSESTATSVGRAKANDLVVNDVAVSSQHCRIRPEDGRFVLHDLKSTNGTFVNERRVTSQLLAEGDVIKIGETHIQFRLDLKRS